MTEWKRVSTEIGARLSRNGQTARDAPVGTLHAMDPNTKTTACGLDLGAFENVYEWGVWRGRTESPTDCDECRRKLNS
jgi:hypothetical protein